MNESPVKLNPIKKKQTNCILHSAQNDCTCAEVRCCLIIPLNKILNFCYDFWIKTSLILSLFICEMAQFVLANICSCWKLHGNGKTKRIYRHKNFMVFIFTYENWMDRWTDGWLVGWLVSWFENHGQTNNEQREMIFLIFVIDNSKLTFSFLFVIWWASPSHFKYNCIRCPTKKKHVYLSLREWISVCFQVMVI